MTDTTVVRHKRGGLYFEDFVIGEVHEHRYTRTVTQMDNMLFSNMTLNPQPLHIDRHFCEPAVRGRHRALHDRDHRQTRVEVAARRRHPRAASPRL
jgi:acyl dehydratase